MVRFSQRVPSWYSDPVPLLSVTEPSSVLSARKIPTCSERSKPSPSLSKIPSEPTVTPALPTVKSVPMVTTLPPSAQVPVGSWRRPAPMRNPPPKSQAGNAQECFREFIGRSVLVLDDFQFGKFVNGRVPARRNLHRVAGYHPI